MESSFKKSLTLEIPAASVLLATEVWAATRYQQNLWNQYDQDPCNLDQLKNKIVGFIHQTVKEQGVHLNLDEKMQDMFTEAIANAYDAHLHQAKLGYPLTMKIVLKTSASQLWINIMDNGSGFLHQPKRLLFQRTAIHEPEKDRNQYIGGVGIGLKNLERAVTAMNGSLFFKNRKEKGATVSIQLPLENLVSERLGM